MTQKDYLKDALSCINRSDYKKAEVLLKEGLKENPDDEKLLNLLSWVLFQLEKYQEMIDIYKKMVKLNSSISFTLFFNLGKAYFHLGDYRAAIDAFIKTIEMVPDHKNALFYLSACYEKLGDVKSSKKILSNIIGKNLSESELTNITMQEGLEEITLLDLITSKISDIKITSPSKMSLYGNWSIAKDLYLVIDGKLKKENFIEHIFLNGEGRLILKGRNIVLNLNEDDGVWINGKYLVGINGSFEGPFNKKSVLKIKGPKKIIIPYDNYLIEEIEEQDIISKEDFFLISGVEKLAIEDNHVVNLKGKGRAVFFSNRI